MRGGVEIVGCDYRLLTKLDVTLDPKLGVCPSNWASPAQVLLVFSVIRCTFGHVCISHTAIDYSSVYFQPNSGDHPVLMTTIW